MSNTSVLRERNRSSVQKKRKLRVPIFHVENRSNEQKPNKVEKNRPKSTEMHALNETSREETQKTASGSGPRIIR